MLKLSFVLTFLLIASCANATTYYVKDGGNDSLDGLSDATAWATIAKVTATVTSGDTVYFRSQDTWTTETLPVLNAAAGVTYIGNWYGTGTRAKFKALGDYPPVPDGAVVNIYTSNVTFRGFEVDGNTKKTGGVYVGMQATSNISNITVDDCKIHDNGYNDSNGVWYCYALHVGSKRGHVTVSNVTLTNNEVYNASHEGIAIYPGWGQDGNVVDGLLVRGNVVHDTALFGGTPWGSGIDVTNEVRNATFEFNTVYRTARGFAMGTSTVHVGDPTNIVVRYNLFYNNSLGINFISGSGMQSSGKFYGNILYNNYYTYNGTYPILTGSEIYLTSDGISTSGYNLGTTTLEFYNNAVYDYATGSPFQRIVSVAQYYGCPLSTPTFTFKNNIVYTDNFDVIVDQSNLLTHSNNLLFRTSGASSRVIQNTVNSSSLPSASVNVTYNGTYTFFTKAEDGVDWTTLISPNYYVVWSGFNESRLNGKMIYIRTVSRNELKSWQLKTYTDSATVIGQVWVLNNINRSQTTTWESSTQNTDPAFESTLYTDPLFLHLRYDSPAIDAGTESLVSDISDNHIYGPPDIGAYEYQPPYTMSIDKPDISANVRVYGDSKFRNKNSSSGTPADLSIIPSSGNTRQYLDVQILNWTASNKQWTESSDTLGSTTVSHSVGGLTPATNYDVYYTKDGGIKTKLASAKADAHGRISFTYGNGFSSVTFEVLLNGTNYSKADLNQDGCVDMTELSAFLARWYINNQDVTMKELMEAIGLWNEGCS